MLIKSDSFDKIINTDCFGIIEILYYDEEKNRTEYQNAKLFRLCAHHCNSHDERYVIFFESQSFETCDMLLNEIFRCMTKGIDAVRIDFDGKIAMYRS